ncbi:MAG: MBL fold metallo-hydrolase [Clostridiaceae bacterium]|nr:MBL fold metallo-hydrolase [Clostridiaceae bacterium]
MKLTWLGHACFRLDTTCGSVVFDPFQDGTVPGCSNIRETADLVLCSHGHGDHNAKENVVLTGNTPSFRVLRVPCFHDEVQGAKRGENVIHIIEAEGMRAAHFGDLGHALSPEQLREIGPLDLAMIPVGGFYTIDAAAAKQLTEALDARVVVPMHYRTETIGLGAIGPLDAFTSLFDSVTTYPGASLTLTPDMPKQIAVLTYGK